ncbi:MFS transporter [Amycolatopsis sp. 195334CR]|uniref:MFS transporter n=1 Tax=Amycolatopsis sp. 195334CR TaxID=2814588 RepID=UPI001A90AA12|nr:MFS transporter [Amycolatopsis sp. 195334CR]MBN6035000.1 MFS transporter [Amycolatopsis sp. 195334CR]
MTAKASRKDWFGLAVLVLACLLVSMDMSVLLYAIPFLSEDLTPSSTQLLWIIDIYGFLLAGLLITMGSLGDRIGRRRLLLSGAALFGLASVAAAFSTSPELLITARALLGVAGATLAPSTLALIRNMFTDPDQRRAAIGIWTGGFAGGVMIGPIVGGFLLEHFWWGSVFLINVPVMVLLLVLAPLVLPEFTDPRPGRFDLVSAGLSLAAVLPIIYGIKEFAAGASGWEAAASLAAGLVVGVVFVHRQRAQEDPMIDLRLFANRRFSTAIGTTTVTQFAMMGLAYFSTQYLQSVLGFSPLEAALWTLPTMVGMFIGLALGGTLATRVRPAYLMGGGLAIGASGYVVFSFSTPDSGLPLLLTGGGLMTLGVGIVTVLATEVVLATAPPERAGAASALSETSTEFGGALGMAVLGTIGAAVYRSAVDVPAGLPPEAAAAAHDTLGGAVAVAANLPPGLAPGFLRDAYEAFTDGMSVTMLIGAGVLLAAAALVAVLLRQVSLSRVEVHG